MSEGLDKENKIVSLRFDNENFEKNVAESLKTLQELKESLKFDGMQSSLSNIEKAVNSFNLGGLGDKVDYIASRFGLLGIAVTKVKSQIADFAISNVKKLATAGWSQILSGGRRRAENLEQARFQLQGLTHDTKVVAKVMGDGGPVQNAVKGTAYGLDEAAKAASQVYASGLTDVKKMEKALTAISGVAAMTNSSYSEIADIFVTISGQGKLSGMQLQQFANRGLNVAAALAKKLGTTEEEIRKNISKGAIDFETFYTVMFDEYAEHAKAANDTYSGSLANLKAAFSRIGADVFTVYLEKMRNVFNALRPVIDAVHVALGPVIKLINKGITVASEKAVGWINKFGDALSWLTKPAAKLKETVTTVKKVARDLSYVNEMAMKVWRGDYGNGQERIDRLRAEGYCWEAIQNRVNELLGCSVRHTYELEEEVEVTEEQLAKNEELYKQYQKALKALGYINTISGNVKGIWSSLKNIASAMGAAIKKALLGTDFMPVLEMFVSLTDAVKRFVNQFTIARNSSSGIFEAWTSIFRGIFVVVKAAAEVFMFLAQALMIVLGPAIDIGSFLIRIVGLLFDVNSSVIESIEGTNALSKILKVLEKVIKPVRDVIQKLSNTIINFLKEHKPLTAFVESFKDGLYVIYAALTFVWRIVKVVFTFLFNGFKMVVGLVKTIGGWVKDLIGQFMQLSFVQTIITTVSTYLTKFYNTVKSTFENVINKIREFLNGLKEANKNPLDKLIKNFRKAKQRIKEFVDQAKKFISENETIQSAISALKDAFSVIVDVISRAYEVFKSFFGIVKDGASRLVNYVKENTTLNGVLKTMGSIFMTVGSIVYNAGKKVWAFIKYLWELPIVQEYIQKIKDVVMELAEKAKPVFEEVAQKVKEFAENLKSIDVKSFEDIFSRINEKLGTFKERLGGAWEVIRGIFKSKDKLNGIKDIFENLKKSFADFKKGDFVKGITRSKGSVLELFGLTNFEFDFKGMLEKIKGLIQKIDLGQIMSLSFAGASINIMSNFAKVEKAFSGTLESVTGLVKNAGDVVGKFGGMFSDIGGSFKTVGESIQKFLHERNKEKFSTTMLKFAISIGILAAALWALSKVPPDDLQRVCETMALMIGVFLFAAYALAQIGKQNEGGAIQGVARGLLGIAFAGLILVGTLKLMEALDPEKLGSNIVALLVIIFTLAAAARLLSKSEKSIIKGGAAMIGFALAVAILAKTLVYLSNTDMEHLGKGLFALIALVGVLALLGLAMRAVKPSSGFGAILFVISLVVFEKMLMFLAKDFDATLVLNNLDKLIVIMGMMMTLTIAMRIAGKGAAKAGGGMILMSIAMMLLVAAIKMIANVEITKLMKGVLVIGALAFILSALMECSDRTKDASLKGLIGLALAMTVLVAELIILTEVDGKKLAKAVLAMGGLMLSFAAVLWAAGSGKMSKDRITAMIAILLSMVVVVGLIAALAYFIDPVRLIGSAIAISMVMLTMGATFKIIAGVKGDKTVAKKLKAFMLLIPMLIGVAAAIGLLSRFGGSADSMIASAISMSLVVAVLGYVFESFSKMSYSKNTKKKIADFLLLTLSLAPIGAAIWALSNYGGSVETMIASAVSLSIVVGVLSGCFMLISKTKADIKSIGAFVLASLALIPVAAALWVIADKPTDSLIGAAVALSTALSALCGTLVVLSFVGKLKEGAFIGILALDALIADLGLVMVALGKLFKSPESKALLNGGIEILETIGTGLGEFVGAIVSGIGIGITDGMPKIADNLSDFAERIQPFIDSMSGVKEDTLSGVGTLVDIIGALAGADFKSTLSSWFTGNEDYSALGEKLNSFGQALVDFSALIADVDPTAVTGAANAGKALIEMADALPGKGGLSGAMGKIIGEGDLKGFGDELVDFAPAFVDFAGQMENVKPEVIDSCVGAANSISAFAKGLKGHGGTLQKLMGDATLSSFAEELTAFGPAFATYAEDVAGVDTEVVNKSTAAADSIAEFAGKLKGHGGVLQELMGDSTLQSFGIELVHFGFAFSRYADVVKGVDTTVVETSIVAAESVAAFASKLESHDGFLQKIVGDNKLSDFGAELASFGMNFGYYNSYVRGVSADIVGKSIAIAEALLALSGEVSENGTSWWTKFTGGASLVSFGADIELFGQNISKFYNHISDIKAPKVNAIRDLVNAFADISAADGTSVKTFAEAINGLNGESLKEFLDSFNDPTAIANAITDMFKILVAEIQSRKETMRKEGQTVGLAFINGLKTYVHSARSIGSAYVSAFLGGISALGQSVYLSGSNTGLGFVRGMESQRQAAVNAAAETGRQAAEALNSAKGIDAGSPSKKTTQSGKWFGEGFIFQVQRMIPEAINAGQDLGNSAVQAIADTINGIAEVMDSDIDLDPTITPVLDLSNVSDGATRLNAMLSRNRALSIATSQERVATGIETESTGESGLNQVFNYTQNNYSPKALSRVDIYRQTRNQFAQLKGVAGV